MIKNVIVKKTFFFCILLFSSNIQSQTTNINNENLRKETTKIYFIENKGQIIDQCGEINTNVKFLLNTPGLNVLIRSNGFSYDVYSRKEINAILKYLKN